MATLTEDYPSNLAYGLSYWLKRRAGMPLDEPLDGILQHGLYLDERPHKAEIDFPMDRYFSWCRWTDEGMAAHKEVVPVAAPWLYTLEYMPDPAGITKEGTLFIPQHGTDHITIEHDEGALREALAEYPQPVKILAWGPESEYWKQFGQVVTCGERHSKRYLIHLWAFFATAELIVTDHLGTSAVYATAAGFPTEVDLEVMPLVLPEEGYERESTPATEARKIQVYDLLGLPDLAREMLRGELLKPGPDLLKDLRRDSV